MDEMNHLIENEKGQLSLGMKQVSTIQPIIDISPEEIVDTFKGNRACLKPDSLMNTQRIEGDFVYYKREELYD